MVTNQDVQSQRGGGGDLYYTAQKVPQHTVHVPNIRYSEVPSNSLRTALVQ